MKIAVLAGGYSTERDVSLCSGVRVANALISRGHRVALADVYRSVDVPDIESLFCTAPVSLSSVPEHIPDLQKLKKERGLGKRLIGDGVLALCRAADITFLALHGGMGEDGTMQAVLEAEGLPFTGSRHRACALAMDKAKTKAVLAYAGIPVPKGIVYGRQTSSIPDNLFFPCVIKPVSLGSSVGVSMIEAASELTPALLDARAYEDDVLIEEKIGGREFSCGILDGKALPPIEIRPRTGFYDYRRKYQAKMTSEICPAPLSEQETRRLRELAEAAHRALGLAVYSRIDFIQDNHTGEFVCLEANTLPGLTEQSLFPKEAAAAGLSYEALAETIVSLSLALSS